MAPTKTKKGTALATSTANGQTKSIGMEYAYEDVSAPAVSVEPLDIDSKKFIKRDLRRVKHIKEKGELPKINWANVKKELSVHLTRLFQKDIHVEFYNLDDGEEKVVFCDTNFSLDVAVFHGHHMVYVASPSAEFCQEAYKIAENETGLSPIPTDEI